MLVICNRFNLKKDNERRIFFRFFLIASHLTHLALERGRRRVVMLKCNESGNQFHRCTHVPASIQSQSHLHFFHRFRAAQHDTYSTLPPPFPFFTRRGGLNLWTGFQTCACVCLTLPCAQPGGCARRGGTGRRCRRRRHYSRRVTRYISIYL
jgi:hypothetical protein